jgi:hypothetical protein
LTKNLVNDKAPILSLILFTVLPYGTYMPVSVLLLLLKTFLEVFFWNHLLAACHAGNYVFSRYLVNSEKSHGDRLGE